MRMPCGQRSSGQNNSHMDDGEQTASMSNGRDPWLWTPTSSSFPPESEEMSLILPLAKHATLLPMIVATGVGIGGGIAFGIHYLVHSPEVVLRKRSNPHPWNNVAQHTNTKLFSFNPEFWEGRSNAPDPRFSLMENQAEASRASHEKDMFEKAKHI
ncbi:hypothetical protein Pst134EA_020916 [Puccinia striiformis f. sp. tritici]|nr:hypothetical protein Pst134EA_020916 [Puccinia striiformis f. sp. tritici]KAH9457013.1 hypothetical protein Pst134EA_020916 [Puccinia striiformis f. sp. tritici]